MIDHDRLFKELISTFFWEFLELFTPNILEYIEKDSLFFLPEEVFTDVTSGEKRRVDLLAQGKLKGKDTCFLIHIENQAYYQTKFNRRMFNYCARLHEKYQLPIYPIVIFSYDQPLTSETNQYKIEFPDLKVLEFNYITIQLNRLNWRTFLTNPNPIAAALMAKMQFKVAERPKVKLECLRMLVTLQLDPARIQLISGFVDTYLRLNQIETEIFETDLKQINLLEKEQVMEIVTSWMEIGIEKGIKIGLETGIEKGLEKGLEKGVDQEAKKITLRLIKRYLGEISLEIENQINKLSVEKVETLAESLFDFKTQDDLINWLNSQKQSG